MCGATCLLIPYLHDMVSNLWNLMSSVCVMQCHAQTLNIRFRWLHFLKQISLKFWSSLAFTGRLVQAANSYAQGELYLYLAFFLLLIFKQVHWLGWWCTLMQTLVQDVSVLLWPMFYSGTCFVHFLCSKHTTLLTCFLSRSRVTTFSIQYCKTFRQCLWYACVQGVMAITSGSIFAVILFNFGLHMIITTAKYMLKDFTCLTISCKNFSQIRKYFSVKHNL